MINPSGLLAQELEDVAARLRASTVQVQRRRRGGGSGVIWRSKGLIVTNAHVVPGPETFVRLSDGSEFVGTILARDFEHDLAAVWVNANNLPSVTSRDARTLTVGELVLAMGNPSRTVGALRIGIIHAISRAKSSSKWIEADLDLPPGYSGGPLSDANGRVVGINSMASKDGRGFAVPTNAVEAFLSDVQGDASNTDRRRQ